MELINDFDIELGAGLVTAETYQTLYCSPIADTIFLKRDHSFKENSREIDCYGNFWTFAFSNFSSDQVYLKTGGKFTEVVGPCALITPPFSIIDWNMRPGQIRWYAFMSKAPYPTDMPQLASFFQLPENFVVPQTAHEIFSLIRNAPDLKIVEKQEAISSVALRTKQKIQETLGDTESLLSLAEELGYSHSVMTRYFKKNFEISPIDYRSRCRIFESMLLLMLREKNVTQAGFEVGFEDCSAFFRQFKRQTRVSPSQFLEVP
jgi:AraC-like DNA-binding protein